MFLSMRNVDRFDTDMSMINRVNEIVNELEKRNVK